MNVLNKRAFTLIEMIGVLTVISILALVLAPVLIRQMDRIAGEQESASLKSIGDGLQQSIMRNRYIPTYTNWHSTVAAEIGLNLSNITTNVRKQPRFFLVDPNWQVGSAVNPGTTYQQATAGAQFAANTRVIILSSIGQALTSMSNGVPSSSDFNAIWDWNDSGTTVPAASILGGFSRSEDLKVQRVNLTPLFVRLLLTTYGSDGTPRYSIDSTNCATATGVNVVDAYFIRSSVLTLYTHLACSDANVIDSRYVLSYDNSFVYNQNVWRPSIVGGQTIGGLDIGTVVDEFLKAPPNLNVNVPHGIDQQRWLVTNMMSYMDAYVAWAGTSFQSPQLKSAAISRQGDMMDTVFGLFEKLNGKDCTPVNNTACTNSP